jgi:dTMP kinase
LFIALEGIDGCGKSTQAALLALRWQPDSTSGALLLREPGSTALGERIRHLLKDPNGAPVAPIAELLLFAAARAQMVVEQLRPTLAAGRNVVCDRFTASTLAYQGHGRGIDLATVAAVNEAATGGLTPDLTLLLDIDSDTARARRRVAGSPDRFEVEAAAFYERVRSGYQALAAAAPDRWAIIDGRPPADQVAAAVWEKVRSRFGLP